MCRFQRPIIRFPRPEVKRFKRPVHRFPRDLGGRFPRYIIRFPRPQDNVVRQEEFPPLYNLQEKPRDKFPDLFEELQTLKDRFTRKGRKISIHCPYSGYNHLSALEVCFTRCKIKCEMMNYVDLVGEGEGPVDYMDDFARYQRLSNLIYGTVREKDIEPDEDNLARISKKEGDE